MYRVEDKYALPLDVFRALQKKIEAIMPEDSNSGPDGYKISSIYFDDLFDTFYRDTVDGVPIRRKFRIRIYNDSLENIKLEVKTKVYSRIDKASASITYEEMQNLIDGKTIAESGKPNDPRRDFNEAILRGGLRPKVIVTYDRKAFVCESGNVRITFDRFVRGSQDIERFGDPELVYDYAEEAEAILEVKYDEFLPAYIAQTIENNQLWQISNSKYRICRELYRV